MIDDKTWKIAKIAKLYYEDCLTQAAIAKRFKLSRSTVSRILEQAKSEGIVEVKIRFPWQRVGELESALYEKYHLKSVRVLKTVNEWSYNEMLEGLGILASRYFKEIVQPNSIVAISSGNAVYQTVKALEPQNLNLGVVQMMGVTQRDDHLIDGPELVQMLAHRMSGHYIYMQAPFIINDPEVHRKLYKEQPFQDVITWVKESSCALVGIGMVDPIDSSLLRTGFSIDSLNELIRCGAVGEICGQPYDEMGQPVQTEKAQKGVSIELNLIKNIPYIIGIAGGIEKASAILGALTGQLINVLVTDQMTAEAILKN
jgi:deoxyribonucleoside regulator